MTDSKDPRALVEEVLREAFRCGQQDYQWPFVLNAMRDTSTLKTLMELVEKGRALENLRMLAEDTDDIWQIEPDRMDGKECWSVIRWAVHKVGPRRYSKATPLEAINAALEGREQNDA